MRARRPNDDDFGKRTYAKNKIYTENGSMLPDSTSFRNNKGPIANRLYTCYAEQSLTLLSNTKMQIELKKHSPTADVTTKAK